MIGVILWCDPVDQKAVIWCEDQGNLAYMARPDSICLPESFVDVGDIVEFDVATERSTRLARNMNVVAASEGSGLVAELKAMKDARPARPSASAEIIPFRLATPVRRSARVTPQRQSIQT